jgi:tRNA dimethylallyltransferase
VEKIIIIAGPTAAGKTAAAAALALAVGGEVVSADSMQIYKYMDIGTAKPTESEKRGVPHHLVNELFPDEEYSAAAFRRMADVRIREIIARDRVPIVAGGSGFYIRALLSGEGFEDGAGADGALREAFAETARERGAGYLHALLAEADPNAAAAIHPNNVKRVIRALEYNAATGGTISGRGAAQLSAPPAYDASVFILAMDRAALYARVDARVDRMFAAGLVGEVRGLLAMGYSRRLVSMQGLGYKETAAHIEDGLTEAEARELIKLRTRRFAKRQITWFSRQLAGEVIDAEAFGGADGIAEHILQITRTNI